MQPLREGGGRETVVREMGKETVVREMGRGFFSWSFKIERGYVCSGS
ncbi:MAG: hypothetical protein ACI906_001865 [Candidatus Latescibacterota bacterium]|jgi:hypothetical protein